MPIDVYWVPGPWRGRLGIAPRPRGGDWLEDELHAWRKSGVDIVVSMLTPEEEAELDLSEEESLSRRIGIEFKHFPIPDRDVPTSRADVEQLVDRLAEALASGRNSVVHCRQGIGRSGLVAALVLIAAGEPAENAFETISTARGRPVPDTEEQRAWVGPFAEKAAKRASGTVRVSGR